MSDSSELTASILITNYNYGRYLPDAIDSALGQTWPHMQVIVVDDGSKDESGLLLESYGGAIQTVFKKNGGQASSVNAGFPLITGDAVIFLDADDMLDPTTIERTIGFFAEPDVVKVGWPMAIVDINGYPTGEIRFQQLSVGDFRERAFKIGPASHFTPSCSANIWSKRFLDEIFPVPEEDFRNVVDAYLFTFSPFFGVFRGWDEPLTFYRVHGKNISRHYAAGARMEDWETRATHLHAWLIDRGEKVTIEKWRKNNPFFQRLAGILRGEAKIGKLLPLDAPIVLIGGRLYDRADIRPARPVYRPPDDIRLPERTEADFRSYLDEVRAMGVDHIAVEGSATWSNTNLGTLVEILRTEHEVLYEDKWIVVAKVTPESGENAM